MDTKSALDLKKGDVVLHNSNQPRGTVQKVKPNIDKSGTVRDTTITFVGGDVATFVNGSRVLVG